MTDVILFDITRLMGRLRLTTPTGIDRVEFAYARYLRETYPRELKFVIRWRDYLRVLPTEVVARYLDFLDHQWGLSDPRDIRRLARSIGRFLGTEHIANDFEGRVVREQRQAARRMWRLRLRLSVYSRPLRLHLKRPGECRVYINVSQQGLHEGKSIRAWVEKDGLDPVFLLHDLIPITHPEYVREGYAETHEQRVETMLLQGASILTNSEATAAELRTYAARRKMALPPVDVALLSSGFRSPPANLIFDSSTAYFVVIGTIEPRKNHIFLLHVWRHLAERMGERTPKLLIIGRRGWENENAIDLMERCAAIKDHVLECGNVPDIVLHRLMKGAAAVLFPSFVEGYGMPLVEALALEVPVIASDIEVFREIAPDVPEFLDPVDGLGWARLVEAYSDPASERRQAQLARMRGFDWPTWDAHFVVFERALDRIRAKAPSAEAAPAPARAPTLGVRQLLGRFLKARRGRTLPDGVLHPGE